MQQHWVRNETPKPHRRSSRTETPKPHRRSVRNETRARNQPRRFFRRGAPAAGPPPRAESPPRGPSEAKAGKSGWRRERQIR